MENKYGQEFLGSDSEYDVVEGITNWELVNTSDAEEDDADVDFAFSSSSSEEEIEEEVKSDDVVDDVIGSEGEVSDPGTGPVTNGSRRDPKIPVNFRSYLLFPEAEDLLHQAVADATSIGYADDFPHFKGIVDLIGFEEGPGSGPYPSGYADYYPTLQEKDDDDDDDYDDGGYYDEYDLDDELMPRSMKGKLGKERIKKMGKRAGFARMKSSKKMPHHQNRPGCVYGKHGLGVQHSYI